MIETLMKHVRAAFDKYASDNEDCAAIVSVIDDWTWLYGFNRTGNVTDHNVNSLVRGDVQSRVSLDTFTDGAPVGVLNQTQENTHGQLFASAVHMVILAWRKVNEVPDEAGKIRLLGAEFTRVANFIGLTKVADKNPITGKDVSDKARRAWYGLSSALIEASKAFEAECPELPTPFVGTKKTEKIGNFLLPCKIATKVGNVNAYVRIPGWTVSLAKIENGDATVNESVEAFEKLLANADITLDTKNGKYNKLQDLITKDKISKVLETEPEAEAPEVAVAAPDPTPKTSKRDRKRNRQQQAQAAA